MPFNKSIFNKIWVQYLSSFSFVLMAAWACYYSGFAISYQTVALILLMVVSVLAMLFDILPVLLAAVLSSLIWNYFFIPPKFTFHIDQTQDVLMFLLYFFIAMLNAVLNFKIRKEETKARDKEEKEKAIKLYNTLFNSLSHELRTPIAAILGSVDTLNEDRIHLSAIQKSELLKQIELAGERLNRQVENLLHMSRLESGMLQLKFDWCDVNELVQSSIDKFPEEEQLFIRFEPNEGLPLVKLDAGIIEIVLLNLIHNAISYAPKPAMVQITANHEHGLLRLTVSDNGKGVSIQESELIFDKFYRLPQSAAGGVGLGLSIVKGFVEAHGGAVRVASSGLGGAMFILEIPSESSHLNSLSLE